jgi:hypothetical protein
MRKLGIFLVTFCIMIGVLVISNRVNQPKQPPGIGPIPPMQTNPKVNPPEQPITIQDALATVDKGELTKILYWLASPELEGRMSAKKGNDSARDYLVKYYQSLGYEVSTQEFTVQNLNNFKEQGSGRTANVIATLPGNDPLLSGETVIIGAHFDHIGYGPSMSRAPQRREIHPGADDNASGTTALMGAAKALAKMKGKNKRRIVVISFSAEEMGLIGAKYYVNNPKYSNTVFMLNMDMVGRYKNKGTIDALGAGSSPEVRQVVSGLTGYPFKPNITSGSGGGSDHAPFYQKGIPICFLHTGMHDDYHTPDDTADKIDYDGLTWVAKYSAHITWEMCQLPSRPQFRGEVGVEVEFMDHDWKRHWK